VEGSARALHRPEKETALGQLKRSGKEREVATLGHLEKSIEEREELCPGEPRHNSGIGKGDALASSQAQEGLQNNKIRCYTKEKVSKTKEAHTVPPPVVQMNHLPSIPLPTPSETHNDPSRGRETATPSTQLCSFEDLSSRGLEERKLRQDDAVNDRRSKANTETKSKLTKTSVEPQDQGKRLDSPSKARKGPDKGSGQLEKHPTGARSCEHSKTNVSNEVEHEVPPNLPGTVYTQPHAPNRETQGFPNERSCFRVAEGMEPRHKDAVNKRCSKPNAEQTMNVRNRTLTTG
jgi:hypothetical protein